MLFTEENEPILKVLIDGELSEEQIEALKGKPSLTQELSRNLSVQCLLFLKMLLEKHEFDVTAKLKDGSSLKDYAENNNKKESATIINRHLSNMDRNAGTLTTINLASFESEIDEPFIYYSGSKKSGID